MSQPSSAATQTPPSNRVALVALILGGAAIGGSPIFVRLSEVGPIATAFWRVALALIPIYLFSLTRATAADRSRRHGQGLRTSGPAGRHPRD
jgi:hypothetical protein